MNQVRQPLKAANLEAILIGTSPMKAIDIHHATIGTVSSRTDGSIAFRVNTPELRASEAGAVMGWHGKACRVTILPDEGEPEELIKVETERDTKSPGQRLRSVIFVLFKEQERSGSFQAFYEQEMERVIEHYKKKLPDA
jgi:hypothetical protein